MPIPPGICHFTLIRKAVNAPQWGQQIYTKTTPHLPGQLTIAPNQEEKQVGRCIISQICCSLFICLHVLVELVNELFVTEVLVTTDRYRFSAFVPSW